MAGVAVRHVTKRFASDVVAVDDFNLDIADGEFLVLVGPSGCGKTTMLRCIAGLERADEGEIEIDGRIVNDLPAKRRNIAMVFQSYALFPHMNVYSNLAFGLKLQKLPKREIDTRVRNAAGILGLESLLDRKPKQLSGGQRQRVALGRAIVREPAVFLMDEPLSNLDAKLRVQTRAEIVRLRRRLGATIVYVTHDQIEAMTMGDRLAVMQNGRIQQVGSPREVYNFPANTFVAGFIGSPAMNFIPMELTADGLSLEGTTFPLGAHDLEALERTATGRSVIVGFRPEHVRLARPEDDGSSDRWSFDISVDVVEYLGSGELVHAQLEGHEFVALIESDRKYEVGERLELVLPMANLHLFDAQTTNRLALEKERRREASRAEVGQGDRR